MPKPFAYKLEQEVTVSYPPELHLTSPRNGEVAKRQRVQRNGQEEHRYTVLFHYDDADPRVREEWITPCGQQSMVV